MIFKIELPERQEFAQAKNELNLLQSYCIEYGYEEFLEIKKVTEISIEEAKKIMLKNTDVSTFDECPEFSLYDTVVGDDFVIVGSTDWD